MFDCAPTTIGAMSPRSTAPYQTLASSPSVRSPMTAAVGAMNAVGWIFGGRTGCALLVPGGREQHLGPGLDRRAILDGRVPGDGPDKVADFPLEGGIIGRTQAHEVHSSALGRNLDPQEGGSRGGAGVGRHVHERRVDRLGA